MNIMNDSKLFYSESTEPTPMNSEVRPITPEIMTKNRMVSNPLENVSQMIATLSKQVGESIAETGFDGQVIVACPFVILYPNKN